MPIWINSNACIWRTGHSVSSVIIYQRGVHALSHYCSAESLVESWSNLQFPLRRDVFSQDISHGCWRLRARRCYYTFTNMNLWALIFWNSSRGRLRRRKTGALSFAVSPERLSRLFSAKSTLCSQGPLALLITPCLVLCPSRLSIKHTSIITINV